MNSHSLKLSGRFEIPDPLDIDTDYNLNITGSIDAISKHSDGGEFEYVYSLKPMYGDVELKGKTVKFVKKGSKSQVLRAKILACGLDYDKEMDKLIENYQ